MNESKLRERFDRSSSESLDILSSAPGFFVVKGSRGTHYNVFVDDGVHCTCPDAEAGPARGMPLCKHRILVLTRVYGMDWEEVVALARELFARGFSARELREPTVTVVNPRDTEACAICLEPFESGATGETGTTGTTTRTPGTTTTVHCKTQCGTLFHAACMRTWLRMQTKCPMCRAAWKE